MAAGDDTTGAFVAVGSTEQQAASTSLSAVAVGSTEQQLASTTLSAVAVASAEQQAASTTLAGILVSWIPPESTADNRVRLAGYFAIPGRLLTIRESN